LVDVVYLQAKKWDGTIGRPEVQRSVGALDGKRAKKGVFITNGDIPGRGGSLKRLDSDYFDETGAI
jgi:restriction endonuclease Mrr